MLCLYRNQLEYVDMCNQEMKVTYAIILTSFPWAPASIFRANCSARASIELDGGTVAVITSMPRAVSASLIPRQYWTPGRYGPARRSSSNPSKPWARTTGYFGAANGESAAVYTIQVERNKPYLSRIIEYSSTITLPWSSNRGSRLGLGLHGDRWYHLLLEWHTVWPYE